MYMVIFPLQSSSLLVLSEATFVLIPPDRSDSAHFTNYICAGCSSEAMRMFFDGICLGQLAYIEMYILYILNCI